MQFVYKPEGVEPKKWDFNPSKMMNAEAETIERLTKQTFQEWADSLIRGSVVATHAYLYVMLKRERPTLKYDEVVFSTSEVELVLDDAEQAEAIAGLEKRSQAGPLSDEEQELLDVLRADAAAPDEDADPKEA